MHVSRPKTVDDAPAAERSDHLHEPTLVGDRLADDRGVAAERMSLHRRERSRGAIGRNDCDQLAFVRDIERIEAQEFAGCGHFGLDWDRLFVDLESLRWTGEQLRSASRQARRGSGRALPAATGPPPRRYRRQVHAARRSWRGLCLSNSRFCRFDITAMP